jgi:hypothetical protein
MHLHTSFIHHFYLHITMSSMHLLSRVVTEGEETTVDEAPEEENPTVEVGFDICGSSGEPNTSPNQGKPRSIQPILVVYKYFYNSSPIICALSKIGIGCIPNCCVITLNFRYHSTSV